jgi:hypothetical protein
MKVILQHNEKHPTFDLEATAVSESPCVLVIENKSFYVQFCRQDNSFGFPLVQRCLDERHRRLICDIPYLHPCCTGSLDSLRGGIGLLGDFLSDCLWDIYL